MSVHASTRTFFINDFARQVWENKYAGDYSDPERYYFDLATEVANGDAEKAMSFFALMIKKRFSPGGRILAWAGRKQARVSLMNCTTHSIQEDTLESINAASMAIMRASSRGQGIGIDISKLRPKGSKVNNAALTSTGAISFMEMLNSVGGTIGQNGRRGALLFSIDVGHPDIWRPEEEDHVNPATGEAMPYDFLNVKKVPGRVENANISVKITDEFMVSVSNDKPWILGFLANGTIPHKFQRSVRARELFDKLVEGAFLSAEPGTLFWDTAVRFSNSDALGEEWAVTGVNACTEQVLDQEGVCNLGSMNLAEYVANPFTQDAFFKTSAFRKDVALAVEFLDNVLDIELSGKRYISERQRRSIENLRRIGLGVMGLADALMMLGLPYGNHKKTEKFIKELFYNMQEAAYRTSIHLAKVKGPAWAFDTTEDYRSSIVNRGHFQRLPVSLRKDIVRYGMRNVTVLSIAPTGSISNLYGVSGGIEPLFATSYERRSRMNGSWESTHYVHPAVQHGASVGIPEQAWDTAYTISPHDHIMVQSWAQRFVDQSISKTTNFPRNSSIEDVAEVYRKAWEKGLKGIAVYVDGSRQEQVLTVKETNEESCPACGGELVHESGCTHCLSCDWELCSI